MKLTIEERRIELDKILSEMESWHTSYAYEGCEQDFGHGVECFDEMIINDLRGNFKINNNPKRKAVFESLNKDELKDEWLIYNYDTTDIESYFENAM